MNRQEDDPQRPETPRAHARKEGKQVREDRLKAALKANMGRRKAQAKARKGQEQDKSQGQ